MEKELGKHHKCLAIASLLMSSTLVLFAASNAYPAYAAEQTADGAIKQQTIQAETPPTDEASNAPFKPTANNAANSAGSASSGFLADSATGTTSNQEQGAESSPVDSPAEPVYSYVESETSPHLTYTKDGKPSAKNGWALVNGSWYWFDNSPYASESCWKYINGQWYHFDAEGIMQVGTLATPDGSLWHANSSGAMIAGNNGWVWSEGAWYWVAPSGKLSTGWVWDGGWYWLDPKTGATATGWVKTGSAWYLMDGSGKMLTGWQWRGAWFYLNPSGDLHTGWLWDNGWYWIDVNSGMATSWVNDNGTWYHCSASGIMQSNAWVLDEKGLWHWADGSGAMKNGWLLYKGTWYYLDPEDAHHTTVTGLKTIAENDYYFQSDGGMKANEWVVLDSETSQARYASASGALTGNATIENNAILLTDKEGSPLSGWVSIGGRWFYATPKNGKAATGWLNDNGTWYYLDSQGAMQTGWLCTGDAWYLLGSTGAMQTGWQYVGETWYYLDPSSGAMRTGWLNDNGTWYYLYGSGAMATGWMYVDGAYYYLNGNGAWDPNADPMYWRAQGYYSNTNWLILCDTTRNELCIYWGRQGNWKLQKYWTCSTGAWSTPTVLGEFTVGAKGYVFGSGFSCYYYTQFYGDYLFHSVTYYQNTFNVMDGRLGMNLSHGCVRLQIDNAKWIYDNIPYGTKVVTF